MQSLFRNRYADALAKTILFFGAVHLIILGVAAVRVNIFVLNAFKILNLDLFMPDLGAGVVNLLLSYGVVAAVYFAAYIFLTEGTARGKAWSGSGGRTIRNRLPGLLARRDGAGQRAGVKDERSA